MEKCTKQNNRNKYLFQNILLLSIMKISFLLKEDIHLISQKTKGKTAKKGKLV